MELRDEKDLIEIFTALMKARQAIEPILKTEEVKTKDGKKKYSYADLPMVYEKVLPKLFDHNLVISSRILEGQDVIEVKLFHVVSGASLTTPVPLIYSKEIGGRDGLNPLTDGLNPMQRMGSAITYATRYGVLMLLAISPSKDDDGIATASTSPLVEKKASPPLTYPDSPERRVLISDILNLWDTKKDVLTELAKTDEKTRKGSSFIVNRSDDFFKTYSDQYLAYVKKWLAES